jgi:hypothetical protein
VPEAPDHAAEQDGAPLAERQQFRQQQAAPAQLFAESKQGVDQRGCRG